MNNSHKFKGHSPEDQEILDTLIDIGFELDGVDSDVPLVMGFFDCHCLGNYIRFFETKPLEEMTGEEIICTDCKAVYDAVPNSRAFEVYDEMVNNS